MPPTFEKLARAGLVDTARGSLRERFGNDPIVESDARFKAAIAAVRRIGKDEGEIDHETARSLVRRAATSLRGARRLRDTGDKLRDNQHGLDPGLLQFTTAKYVYRTIIRCLDPNTGQEKRFPVDVESDERLPLDAIEERAKEGWKEGRTVITAQRNDYPVYGQCEDAIVQILFASRTR